MKSWSQNEIDAAMGYLRRRKTEKMPDTFKTKASVLDFEGRIDEFDAWLDIVLVPAGRARLLNWLRVSRAESKNGKAPVQLQSQRALNDRQLIDMLIARFKGVPRKSVLNRIGQLIRRLGLTPDEVSEAATMIRACEECGGSMAGEPHQAKQCRKCRGK